MALNFPTPSEIASQYLTILQSLKPEVDISRQDSDWWVRAQVVGGVLSGIYADQQLVSQDAFPQSARIEALVNHLYTYFGSGLIQPQPSNGDVAVTGALGTVVPQGTEFVYQPNGNAYQSTAGVTLNTSIGGGAATGDIPVQSIGVGQVQNLLSGAQLLCSTPPSGLNPSGVSDGPISGGRDLETAAEAAARILAFIRQPPAGGTATDYERFAEEASPQVTGATVIRFFLGLGSVGIVITAGTTDIDAALNDGVPIVLTPSDALIDEVQDYVNTKKVVTDCVTVMAPNLVTVNVTVEVSYVNGLPGTTVEPTSGLTYDALVRREVQRAIYKTPPGGRQINGIGYLVVADIEQQLDASLSNGPYATGSYAQILADRQVLSLTGSDTSPDLVVSQSQVVIPGTITVNQMD